MIRVIIADDSIHIRYWISRVLSRDADILVVGEACDGLDAVDRIEADEPDVLILDIAMPVLDGVDVVRWLKRNRKTTRVVILSNYADEQLVQEMLRLGADAYVVKDDAAGCLAEAVKAVARDGARSWLSPTARAGNGHGSQH